MKISLENYLRNKLDEVERVHSFDLATDTIRCWIDEYNEQLRQYNVMVRSEQLPCSHCGRPLKEHGKDSKLCPDRMKNFEQDN